MADLVECEECRLKSGSCPKDGAVFELVPGGNILQPFTGLFGRSLKFWASWFILSKFQLERTMDFFPCESD